MAVNVREIEDQLYTVLQDLNKAMPLSKEHILIIGASTSEVAGEHIGSNGSREIATAMYRALIQFKQETDVELAFQCCEHLNRALVVESATARSRGIEPVSVIPVRQAGGAMATHAFSKMEKPVLVEAIRADAGIDIGDTFIGMHLKEVAVPIRSQVKTIGSAHVTLAKTRPKLIGGIRASYDRTEEHE
ncbi:TIGR01440 family protein [Bacillus sp. FJAT-45037]|uniref:TIGR01440 family protein n=1 Tax=Bacillus sp. FJAT-45037 TaxID=2011007 RepID=UPI000C24F45E|nr:TIGR01440 family protein [Bacillus sp. FJAT-45037]